MSKSRNIIEINGKKYDAVTGSLIHPPASGPKPEIPAPKPATPRVMDGVSKPTKHKSASAAYRQPVHVKSQPQHSKTLIRQAVRKPEPHKSSGTPIQSKKILHTTVAPTVSRVNRATHTKQNPLISRFGANNPVVAKVVPLAVQPEPTAQAPQAAPLLIHHEPPAANAKHHAGKQKNPFEHALENAQSHKQPAHKLRSQKQHKLGKLRVSKRITGVATGLAAALLLVGFFAYQNAPNLSMRVASARAGLNARLPGYKPSGFSMNRTIQYSPGQVRVSFASNSDDRSFTLTQQETELTSNQIVREHVASTGNQTYQTYEDQGRTIYIYDGNNATWVEDGVLFRVEGKSALNSDQLLRIASSL